MFRVDGSKHIHGRNIPGYVLSIILIPVVVLLLIFIGKLPLLPWLFIPMILPMVTQRIMKKYYKVEVNMDKGVLAARNVRSFDKSDNISKEKISISDINEIIILQKENNDEGRLDYFLVCLKLNDRNAPIFSTDIESKAEAFSNELSSIISRDTVKLY